jgi:tetratricopeptide (TPR) repeat protein
LTDRGHLDKLAGTFPQVLAAFGGQETMPKPNRSASPRRAPRGATTGRSNLAPPPAVAPNGDRAAALGLYESALAALQAHEGRRAAELFRTVLARYPDDRDLIDRVRLYLRVCERTIQPAPAGPQTAAERLYAATLALNAGAYAKALEHVQPLREMDADNDHAWYVMAAALAQQGEIAAALEHLRRAIALDPANRVLARRDPDLAPLCSDRAFAELLAEPRGLPARAGRRRLR